MSIDGYGVDFHSFLDEIALMLQPARLCGMALVLIWYTGCDHTIFAHLCRLKKYLNNRLDFFIKLVSLFVLKKVRTGIAGRFHSGESSICQSGTLQYETKKNY